MPLIRSWPVWSSSLKVKVGSSWAKTARAFFSLTWSSAVPASMAMEMTGVGKCIFSSRIWLASLERVSPVCASFMPTMTPISPASIELMSSERSACMRRILATRSFLCFPTFITIWPFLIVP